MVKFITKTGKVAIMLLIVGWACSATNLFAQTALPQSGDINGSYTASGNYTGPYTLTGNVIIIVNSGTATINGVISGASNFYITKNGVGTLILTAANTYSGQTNVDEGKLQIGNGTNGSINSTSGVALNNANAILRFEPGADMTFAKVIEGQGNVEYKGSISKTLSFTGENTYTGTTTIETDGYFYIGNNGTTGSVQGDIIVNTNGYLNFNRSNEYTYSKVISGGGKVNQVGSGKTILTGVNFYTGTTYISSSGTLQIGDGSSGSINATSSVYFNDPSGIIRFEPGAAMNFMKFISGGGSLEYKGTATKKLTLLADNTYSGTTTVVDGTLQIGNGTTGSLVNTSKITLTASSSILRFEPSTGISYSKVIEGAGKVELKGYYYLLLAGENTYSGTTTVEMGNLVIGSGTTGSVASDIIVSSSGGVSFHRSDTYTYSKVISGAGFVKQDGSGTTILTGVNEYTGGTYVSSGTLQIGNGSSGSINTTSRISLSIFEAILRFEPGAEMTFTKQIEGTGMVEYKGTSDKKLILTANNTCSGLFTLESGSLEIVKWAGAFTQAAGTTLDIKGNVSLGSSSGALTLQGGDIYMNLTTSPPSKLTAVGAVAADGTTTLHITTGNVTNQTVIQAASGLDSAAPFALDMPGYNASLTATGTQLQLTATMTDITPPVPGAGVNGTATYNSANLTWTAATDNVTPSENLRYYVYQSLSNNITTVADCETNGTLLNGGGSINITAYDVTALTLQTTYYFNVVVIDMANNKAAYIPKELTTGVEPAIVSLDISPETTNVQPSGTQQFTAIIVAEGGADESVTWSVTNNYSTLTTITADGLLTVGSNETAESFTVRVVSVFDPSVSAEATVTVYTGTDPKVLGVTISPKTATVGQNQTQQFTVTVNAVGDADESVTWSIRDNLSAATTVSADGLLTVGSNETATTIIVKVASVLDPDVLDEATVTVGSVGIAPPSPPEGGNVRVYPNPTSGVLRVESGEWRVESVEVFDVFGKNVSRLTSHISHPISIDISFLPAGVYFVRITTDGGVVTRKVIKR